MHEQANHSRHISLSEAAKIAPGRPSTNCLWRWCRRGVLARDGQRIRLQHIRIGGKIFTRAAWLDEFGRRLSDADVRHFESTPTRRRPQRADGPGGRVGRSAGTRPDRLAEIEAAEAEFDGEPANDYSH